MRLLLTILLSGMALSLCAQNYIRGKVIDLQTNQPVAFATVYINGTTVGTDTDYSGAFLLEKVDFPAEVVVSHLSYENVLFRVEKFMDQDLLVKMEASSLALSEVEVTDNDQRQKNLREFKNLFLGIDEFGREASIVNEEVLVFSRDYEKKQLKGFQLNDQNGKEVKIVERPINLKPRMEYTEGEQVKITGLREQTFLLFYYADSRGFPHDLTREKGRQPIQSQIQFLSDTCVIRRNGTVPNNNILFGGPIAEKKVGAMLPDNY